MKTLALPACLAVVAVAAFAELKDPSQVAADWNQAMAQTRESILSPGPLGLSAASPAPQPNLMPRATPPLPRRHLNGDVLEAPPGLQIDPKIQKLPAMPGQIPPPGAKPWYYRGQKFWLIPIAVPGKK